MMGEIEVARFVERHEVDVGVGNIDTYHSLTDLDARTHFLQSTSNFAGKEMEIDKKLVVEVEDVIYFLLGDAENMTFHNGIDIEESKEILGLSNFVAGDLSCNDTRKN